MAADNQIAIRTQHSTDEKLRAAYALNMCTVSVSQIVDYNDAYVLEQEYDATTIFLEKTFNKLHATKIVFVLSRSIEIYKS